MANSETAGAYGVSSSIGPVQYPVVEEKSAMGIHINLRQIQVAVRRNYVWLLGIVAAFVVAGLVITLLITPKYRASAKVLVEQQSVEIIEGGSLKPEADAYDVERFLQTQLDIIRSRTLASRVTEEGKLYENADFFAAMGVDMQAVGQGQEAARRQEARKNAAVSLVRGSLSTNLPMGSRVVEIGAISRSPKISAHLANLYARAFLENNLNRKFDSSDYARKFLQEQLDEARNRVENSERELNRYSRAAGLIRVTNGGPDGKQENALSVTNDSLVQTNNAAGQATAERLAAQDAWETVADQPVLSIPQVNSNAAIQGLLTQRVGLEGQLALERAKHLDDYPSVKALKAQIASLNSRIDVFGQSVKRSIYLQYQAALQKENSLKNEVSTLRSDALTEQDRGVQYSVLKRVADTNRALYDSLLERYNHINANAGAASNNVSIIDEALVPVAPASPNMLFNLLVALVLGVIFGSIFVYLRETFDDTIREPGDVEQKLALPLLGLIPLADDSLVQGEVIANSAISEAYHSLVTNMFFATANGLPKAFGVTSAGESEGKSTTSQAIAVNLAQLGKKVLLIDADLRRPTLHHRIGKKKHPGLTSVLVGQSTLEEAIVPSDYENLHYLTALPVPPNPSLLLSGDRFNSLLQAVRERFDVVIVDCPPLLGLSDTPTISMHLEGMLFMVDATGFHRGAVKAALRRLALIRTHVFGIVLSKFDAKASGGDYSYYSYNYYSYGRADKTEA